MNTITIRQPDQATAPAAMFTAPDNEHAAHELFIFFAENLQDGFIVELTSGTRTISQPTGKGEARHKKLLAALAEYTKLNSDTQLNAFLTGYVGEDWNK